MPEQQVPLYVRLSEEPSRRLERAVAASGRSKRQLVNEAVGAHFTDDGLVVGQIAPREQVPVVGQITLREQVPEVLTLEEAAAFLRVEAAALARAATAGEVPGRRIAGEWRFSSATLSSWLGAAEAP